MHHKAPVPKPFRKDINGLRAWAVLFVILFHFGFTSFNGGFVGVDVFFVISGFLMTAIIVNGLEQTGGSERFSIWKFYSSRARRIIPPLSVLCATLIVSGWFFLPSIDYQLLGKHVMSALGFLSNITFWKESGYFDAASHEKWLLHTWSLAVEWQFYLALPMVLLATWKLWPGRAAITGIISFGLFIFFALSCFLSPWMTVASFYLLPTRAWEMLAGGLAYLWASKAELSDTQRSLAELAGFSLIFVGVFVFDATSNWPGWRASVPVIGTALVLISARQHSLWTATPLAQWLGSRSYSLYLWHWPVVVALVYLEQLNEPAAIISGLALTLVLGHFSYRFVETPTRIKPGSFSFHLGIPGLSATASMVAAMGLAVYLLNGLPGRLPEAVDQVFMAAADANPRNKECHVSGSTPVPECTYGGPTLGAIVIGDSHAASVVRTVERALPSKDLHVLDWTLSDCPTIIGAKTLNDRSYRCGEFVESALEKASHLPAHVPLIIVNRLSAVAHGPNEADGAHLEVIPRFYFDRPFSARTAEYYRDLRNRIISTACEFAKYRPVYMARPTPEMKIDVPRSMGRAMLLGDDRPVSLDMDEYLERQAFAWSAQDAAAAKCGVHILDPLPYLCDSENCHGAINGIPLYRDDDHLSEYGASFLTPMFSRIFAGKEIPPVARSYR